MLGVSGGWTGGEVISGDEWCHTGLISRMTRRTGVNDLRQKLSISQEVVVRGRAPLENLYTR